MVRFAVGADAVCWCVVCQPGSRLMETIVRTLFARYERAFNKSLAGNLDRDEIAGRMPPNS